ncbi:hypothetical protein ABZ468_48515 [Streptomyces sp. NPDC005708]|uniref:hypothetical protein n=1 Tax=Streptomyces sp. NPDC005708 TaxID=3154564 RepID=UPI00340CAAD9
MVSALLDHLADVEDVTPVGRRVAQLRDRAVALVVQRPYWALQTKQPAALYGPVELP